MKSLSFDDARDWFFRNCAHGILRVKKMTANVCKASRVTTMQGLPPTIDNLSFFGMAVLKKGSGFDQFEQPGTTTVTEDFAAYMATLLK